MKKALIITLGLTAIIALTGCNAEDKALEKSAPPVADGATTFEGGGGQPKDVGENDAQATPAEKPAGM